ncbi:MAG: metalloregulator ArsR/SmtB family transcription factor [Anaerolineae bacterium]|nr:metalloregulator ArsR/SmtB family transcription factor [Anaerolineae bacterium]
MTHRHDPVDRAQELFQILSHPMRLRLLLALCTGEECVCDLAARFGRPQPYISQQLAELRQAGLVADRREGRRIFYRLADPRVCSVLAATGLCVEDTERAARCTCLRRCA